MSVSQSATARQHTGVGKADTKEVVELHSAHDMSAGACGIQWGGARDHRVAPAYTSPPRSADTGSWSVAGTPVIGQIVSRNEVQRGRSERKHHLLV